MAWNTTSEGQDCTECGAVFAVGASCKCPTKPAGKPARTRRGKRKRRSKAVVAARANIIEGQRHLLELDGCVAELINLNSLLLMKKLTASAHSTLVKAVGKIADLHQQGLTLQRVEELEERLADLDEKLEVAQGGAQRSDMAPALSIEAGGRSN